MRFYSIDLINLRAVEVFDCTEVVAKDLAECLLEALQVLWYINDSQMEDKERANLVQETNGEALYSLVQKYGKQYEAGEFNSASENESEESLAENEEELADDTLLF